jgi:hypothetical protein
VTALEQMILAVESIVEKEAEKKNFLQHLVVLVQELDISA